MTAPSPQARALATMRLWLADGSIQGGDAMPSEFTLAERLRVSRGTVRKVLATLAGDGLVGARTRGRRIRTSGDQATAEQAVVMIGSGTDDRGLSETQEGSVEDGCLRTLHESGRTVLLVDEQSTPPERALAALGRKPYGIICAQFAAVQPRWREQLLRWREMGLPVVVHGNPLEFPSCDCVHSDHAGGAYELTRRLIAAGRRSIRQIWHSPGKPHWLAEREAGHARAMAEAGLPVQAPLCLPEEPPRTRLPDQANLDQRARAYLGFLFEPLRAAAPPDALITVNDANAVAVALACRMLGRAVHDEIAVAGFDGNWNTSWEWPAIGLTPFLTAHKRNHSVGRNLAEVMLERAAGRGGAQPIVRCLPVDIQQPEPLQAGKR